MIVATVAAGMAVGIHFRPDSAIRPRPGGPALMGVFGTVLAVDAIGVKVNDPKPFHDDDDDKTALDWPTVTVPWSSIAAIDADWTDEEMAAATGRDAASLAERDRRASEEAAREAARAEVRRTRRPAPAVAAAPWGSPLRATAPATAHLPMPRPTPPPARPMPPVVALAVAMPRGRADC